MNNDKKIRTKLRNFQFDEGRSIHPGNESSLKAWLVSRVKTVADEQSCNDNDKSIAACTDKCQKYLLISVKTVVECGSCEGLNGALGELCHGGSLR